MKPKLFVAVGASAGGLEALEEFFSAMPGDSGFGFIVIQHLSPDYKSMMDELISKYTSMRVHKAEEGDTVQGDHIYLIPPKKNLTIREGRLHLEEQRDHSRNLNLPIDVFFQSLAEDQAEKAVGIVLSGTGSDGTRGCKAIKENEGMVMAQTAESSRFDGMPRGVLNSGMADFVEAPQDMPERLIGYSRHFAKVHHEPEKIINSDEDAYNRILTILRENSRVDFSYYKPSTVVRRIERRMSVNSLDSLWDYVRYLEKTRQEVERLSRELLIGVTNFFRDRQVFELLREKVIPEILESRRDREIRFWVAGCSSGEEAYSLAMVTREVMEKQGYSVPVKIFATDVDKRAILKAGEGLYPESIAADVSPGYLAKYFKRREDGYQVARQVREMVVFARQNVIHDPPFTNIDLISCRNMLIYFQPVLQRKVLGFFNFSLIPGGYLILGTSETLGDLDQNFEITDQKGKIFRSLGKNRRSALNRQNLVRGKDKEQREPVGDQDAGLRSPSFPAKADDRLLDRFLQAASGGILPLTLLVDERFEVHHVIGDTKGLFRVPPGKVTMDITKMAHQDLAIPLATGLPKVFKDEKEVVYSNIRLKDDNQHRLYHLRLQMLPGRKDQTPLAAVFLEEKEEEPAAGGDDSRVINYDADQESQQRIEDLEQELQFTRESLQATIEELETSNEELQATNEELLSSNEELQSTNEELQSVNEELYTVNAEYQNKLMELSEANSDMDNLLSSSEVAALFLDDSLEIRRFTENIDRFFKIKEGDVGRPIQDLATRLPEVDLEGLMKQVLDHEKPLEQEVERDTGEWFLMKIIPYMVEPGQYSGVVISFFDITSSRELQENLKNSLHRLSSGEAPLLFGTWNWNIQEGSLIWSEETEQIFGMEPGTFEGTFEDFEQRIYPEDREAVRKAVQGAIEKDRSYGITHRITWPDGAIHWVKETGVVYRSRKGEAVRMVGAVQDTTVQHQMKDKLQEGQNAYEMFFHRMSRPCFLFRLVAGEDGQAANFLCLDANAPAEKLVGRSRNELMGRPMESGNGLCGRLLEQFKDKWPQLGEDGVLVEGFEPEEGAGPWSLHLFSPNVNHLAMIVEEEI